MGRLATRVGREVSRDAECEMTYDSRVQERTPE